MSVGVETDILPDESVDSPESDDRIEISAEDALSWLAAIPSNTLIGLLRQKDFAAVANRSFAGFRANQQGLAIPTVKQRLALEATRNRQFGERLLELYESAKAPKEHLPNRNETERHEREAALARKQEQKRAAELKVIESLTDQRDRLKREHADLLSRISVLEGEARTAHSERHKAEEENSRLRHTIETQAARIERIERHARRHEREMSDLIKEIRSLHRDVPTKPHRHTRPSDGISNGHHDESHDTANVWVDSLRRNLELNHLDAITPVVGEALRSAPNDSEVLEMAADLARRRHDPRMETEYLKSLLGSLLHHGHGIEALNTWARLSLLHPSYPESKRVLQQIVSVLPDKRGPESEEAKRVIGRIKTMSQELHNRVLAAIAQREALIRLFMPKVSDEHGLDKVLVTIGTRRITFGDIANAIDLGDREMVSTIAAHLREMRRTDPTRADSLISELSEITGDPSYSMLITQERSATKTAVVDSSNIAWIGQEDLARGRPRLKSVLDVRKALRLRGYFPVLLYADANLPYAIDDKEKFQHMVSRGEIRLVDAGVVADEEILRNAKRWSAIIVTNDYMEDWDPGNHVKKVGIALSHTGQVSFLD